MSQQIIKAIGDIQDSFTGFQTATGAKLDRFEKRIEELQGRIEHREAAADLPRSFPDTKNYTHDEREHKGAFEAWLRAPNDVHVKNRLGEVQHELYKGQKDITIGTNAAGGFAVPKVIGDQVQMRVKEMNPFVRIVRVVRTSTSDYKELVSDGSTATSGWVAETGTRSATGTPELIERAPTGGELYAYPQMSEWALQDMQFDAADWLIREVSLGFSNNLAAAIVSGSGSNRPTGMLNTTPVTTSDDASPRRGGSVFKFVGIQNANSPLAFNYDTLIHVIHDLRQEYLVGPNVGWIMNRQTVALVRQIRDGFDRPIWQDSLVTGMPPLLLGFPVWIADAMPAPTVDEFPIGFGDWSRAYLLCERNQMAITVDQVTNPGYVRFYVRQRFYGTPLDTNAARFIRLAD